LGLNACDKYFGARFGQPLSATTEPSGLVFVRRAAYHQKLVFYRTAYL